MTTEEQLLSWTKRSSDTEQDKQDRAERMVKDAIAAHAAFNGCSLSIYAKGSYRNNTNVRSDSDVDIAVECTECCYWEEQSPGNHPASSSYSGTWTPAKLRSELVDALEAKFPGQVDASGSIAIRVDHNSSRVDADVVPCFSFKKYMDNGSIREGAKVFKKDGSGSKINYSAKQLENGNRKNNETGRSYKRAVRIMKRVENVMAEKGIHDELPSYFIECLVYNVPNEILLRPTWVKTIKGVTSHIFHELEGVEPDVGRWLEVNGYKYLFHSSQPWTRAQGRAFAKAAWNYLELGE